MQLYLPPKPAIIIPQQDILRPFMARVGHNGGPALDEWEERRAQFVINQLGGWGPWRGTPILTYGGEITDTADQTSYDFSVSPGATSNRKLIIITVTQNRAGATTHSSVSYPSFPFTKVASVNEAATGSSSSIWALRQTTAIPSSVLTVLFSATSLACKISIFTLIGVMSDTPVVSSDNDGSSPATLSLDTKDGGAVIGVASSAAGTRVTWSGLIEQDDVDAGTAFGSSAAMASGVAEAAPRVITCTSAVRGCAAAFR